MTLVGKNALVTGSGTGIGKGIALALAAAGARVLIHYNASDAGARDTLTRIEAQGGTGVLVQADISRRTDVERMFDFAQDALGGIDILVNNAALQLNYDFFEYDEATFDKLMHINLKGYWQCIQAAAPHMKASGWGRILLISSVHGKRPTDFDAVYAMTKGGIRMLGREAAIELGRYGITVTTIEPGAVDVGKQGTSATKPIMPPEEAARLAEQHQELLRRKFPGGRVGLPADVGRFAVFLASEDTAYLNGAAIRLDGGSMLL